MDQQSRYLKDTSGFNHSNLVKAEPHFLTQQVKNRVVVPREGAFFSKTVMLVDRFKNRNLIHGRDFICSGLRVELTRELGQEICSFVIITNDEVSHSVAITYQATGNEGHSLAVPIVDTLDIDYTTSKDIPMYRLKNVPKKHEPTFHYQDLGDIDKFEYMLFSLEKIRNALFFDSSEVFKYITNFDGYITRLLEASVNKFQAELYKKMRSYSDGFKKDLYDLALVENLPPFLKDDGTYIASSPIKLFGSNEEAYLTLEALASFSKKLFELLVNIDQTGIGSSTELRVLASVDKFENLPIGSHFTIANYNFSSGSTNPLVDLFYPDRLDLTTSYFVKKLSAKTLVSGSMFLYIGRENSKSYVMRLTKNDNGYSSHFNKIANLNDSPPILSLIKEHIENKQNPHLDDKRDVDLSQVENLPLATMEDIVCNIPVRKYITLTQLYAYMKRFKTGKKEISEIYENFSERTMGRRLQTLFSPCGAWDDNVDIDKIEMCKPAKIEIEPVTTTTRAPATYTVVPNVTVIHGGETVTFNIATTNVDDATVLYWSANLMDITAASFVNNNLLGEVTIVNNQAVVSLTLKEDVPTTIPPLVSETIVLAFIVNGEAVTEINNAINGDTMTVRVTGGNYEPLSSLNIATYVHGEEDIDNQVIKSKTAYFSSTTVDEDGNFVLFFELLYNGELWFGDAFTPFCLTSFTSLTTIPFSEAGPSNRLTVTKNVDA